MTVAPSTDSGKVNADFSMMNKNMLMIGFWPQSRTRSVEFSCSVDLGGPVKHFYMKSSAVNCMAMVLLFSVLHPLASLLCSFQAVALHTLCSRSLSTAYRQIQ